MDIMATIEFKYKLGEKVSHNGMDCVVQSRSYVEIRDKQLIKYNLAKYNSDGLIEEYFTNVSEKLVQPRRLRLVK